MTDIPGERQVGSPKRLLNNLVFASLEDWDDVWRRNQFICAELVRRDPAVRVLFVGLPRNVSHDLRHGRLAVLWRRATYPAADVERVTVTHPLKLLPDTLTWGRTVNQWLYRRHVRKVARRLGLERPVLWINPHWAGHLAGRIGESAVVYDVTDDWTRMSQSSAAAERVRQQDADLCARADAVIVCSKRLAELKRPMTRHVYLIPNGVDADHYAGVLDRGDPLPAAAARWRRPVLGYTGTVHPERLDIQLLQAVTRRWAGSVVLIGPDYLSSPDRERLMSAGVCLVGPVPYGQLPQFMRGFDVCIVPHRVSDFTESLNPIKLWEYLACGKPVVSTPVAGFRDYPDLVHLANGIDQFCAALAIAAVEPVASEAVAARIAEALLHSWASRVETIEIVIEACLAAKLATSGVYRNGR